MNGLVSEARELATALRKGLNGSAEPEVVVCPPFIALPAVREILEGSQVKLGAQDLHWETKGAFTGEISPGMLRDVGCTHVVIGHSERRHVMGENNEMVNKKIRAALDGGLTPIVCVGELLEERDMGATREVIERQVTKGLEGFSPEQVAKMIMAYEPVWAIGTGRTATPRQAVDVHYQIRKLVGRSSKPEIARATRILYGGSVKPENIRELMAEEEIDGALVGGASLKADSFARIVGYKE